MKEFDSVRICLEWKKKSILSKFRILKDNPLSQVTHTLLLNNKRRFSKEWQFFEKVPQEKKLIYNFFIRKYALLIWNMNSFLFKKKWRRPITYHWTFSIRVHTIHCILAAKVEIQLMPKICYHEGFQTHYIVR